MNPVVIGVAGIILLFVLMFLEMPIGLSFIFVGVTGYALASNLSGALGMLRTVPFSTFTDYGFSVLPLFVLMGSIAFFGRLSGDLYSNAYRLLGNIRGSLGMATIFACGAFSAISGSSVATCATMGKVCLPEMKRYGYADALATGCVAAGATMDILIPPSVIMIIYAIMAEVSIGKVYMAGYIPGAIQVVLFMGVVWIICRLNPNAGPPGPRTTYKEKMLAVAKSWNAIFLIILVMGGMYFGIFSVNEAAGVGAFATLVICVAQRKLSWQGFKDALRDTLKTTAMVFLMIVGGLIFSYFLSVTTITKSFGEFVLGLGVSRYVIITAIVLIYLVLGAIMDEIGMILITVPVFLPVIMALGWDPVWFGIIVVMICQCGAIDPPVAINCFILKGIAPDIPMTTIYKGIIPFSLCTIGLIGLMIAFPNIVMILPNTMR
jgi:tripartite ATP-independent transporter DctM subunit